MSHTVRPAAVAGSFYPDSASALDSLVSHMLAEAPRSASAMPKAVIVPHAGYIYSGPIAASIYAPLRRLEDTVRRVVLLGPTHRVAVDGIAVPASRAFATPLGVVPVDAEAIAAIADLPQIVVSEAAHEQEHSLEVQLPFLQVALGDFALVPLAVGRVSPEAVAEVIERLWGGDETLIVVSSDLSHYLPYSEARSVDARTAQEIVAMRPDIEHHEACGATPVNGLLIAASHHGLHARLLDLRNSGDTAGNKTRVVGYGAFAFDEDEKHAH